MTAIKDNETAAKQELLFEMIMNLAVAVYNVVNLTDQAPENALMLTTKPTAEESRRVFNAAMDHLLELAGKFNE